ncbi:helix-turn-helix domain-containing protein, partial [Clostridium perfringens]
MYESSTTLGQKIRKYRKAMGLTMKELGEKLDLSEQAISQYERDKREPNIFVLKEISRVLQVSISDLICEADFDNDFKNSLIKERINVMKNLNIDEVEKIENLISSRNPFLLNFDIITIFKAYRELIPNNITIEDFMSMSTLISENMISVFKLFLSKYNQNNHLNKIERYTVEYNDFLDVLRKDFKDIDMSKELYFNIFSSQEKTTHLINNYYAIIATEKANFLKNKEKESNITPLPKREKQIWEEEGKEYLMPKASHDKEG